MEPVITHTADYLLLQSGQIVLVFILVVIACRLLRDASAHWRYLLWLVVLARCLVPPVLTVPLAVLPSQATGSAGWAAWLAFGEGGADGLASGAAAPGAVAETMRQRGDAPVGSAAGGRAAAVSAGTSHAGHVGESSRPGSVSFAGGKYGVVGHSVPPAPITGKQWFAVAWAAGALLLLMVAGVRAGRIQRHVRLHRRPAPKDLADQVAALAGQLGMARTPAVWLIDGIAQPFVWGVLRGSIYLPGSFARTGTDDHRRSILMHELAHIARYDAVINLLQVLVQAAFFFHLLVWWANRRIRQEREKCCDEVAIARLDAAPREYCEAIVSSLVHEYESTRPVSSLAVAGPVHNIEERIKTIMNPRKSFHSGPSWLAITSALLLAVLAAPSALVLTARAQDQKPGGPVSAPTSQAFAPSILFKSAMDLDAYPTASPDQLVEQMTDDLLSDKWHSQDGEFASLTLRNPAPDREARVAFHEELVVSAAQKEFLYDSPMSYIKIAGHDEENIVVDATVFVRSATSGEAARAYAEKIEVELAPSDEYVRLGEHVLKLKPKDIEEAGVLYTVKIPRRFGVDARIRNGRLYVTGITGEFSFWGGGALVATNLGGRVWIQKTGGMTLLANVTGEQPVRIDQLGGPIALLNIAAPIGKSILGAALYLDLRKTVPAGVDIDISRTKMANVVFGSGAAGHAGDLDFACDDGEVVVHQADGGLMRAKAFAWKVGSDGPPLKIRMGSGQLNIWAGRKPWVAPQSWSDGESTARAASRG